MKFKKILATVCAAAALFAATCFSGCSFDLSSLFGHTHSWVTARWESDESGHWHVCSGCSETSGFATHRYASDTAAICLDCGWMRKVEAPADGDEDKKPEEGKDPDVPVQSEEPDISAIPDSFITAHANSDYGYKWLKNQPDGAKLQEFYNRIDNLAGKVESGTATLTRVTAGSSQYYSAGKLESSQLTLQQLQTVYRVYHYDHPYNFWQDQTLVYGSTLMTAYVHLIVQDAFVKHSDIVFFKTMTLNQNIKRLYLAADGLSDSYEIALAYYSAIIKSCDYCFVGGSPADDYWAHSIVGVFDDSRTTGPVCEGYARSLQLLLNLKGVDNVYCVGSAANVGTGGGGGHAWNMVKLDDGRWYDFDITWDDGNDSKTGNGGTVRFDYFALSAEDKAGNYTFRQTHFAGDPTSSNGYFLYDLPALSETAYASTDFLAGTTVSDSEFTYVRNGVRTVGINRIKTLSDVVTIPETVEVDGVTYTVTELGPYVDGGYHKTILTSRYTRSIVLHTKVTSIRSGAFYTDGQITFYYYGTQQQWNDVLIAESAFGSRKPVLYCEGKWELRGKIPMPKF